MGPVGFEPTIATAPGWNTSPGYTTVPWGCEDLNPDCELPKLES